VADQVVCRDADSARVAAARLGYPVALKALGHALVHKSDAGGVSLGLASEAALMAALKDMQWRIPGLDGVPVHRMERGAAGLILGVTVNPHFGPRIVLGAGGVLVELLKDVASASAPAAAETVRDMLGGLKVSALLRGLRGRAPLDFDAVVDAVVRLGWLAQDLRGRLKELDINPLIVRRAGEGCIIVDARALLR